MCRVAKHIVDKLVQMHKLLGEPKLCRVVNTFIQNRGRVESPEFSDVVDQVVQNQRGRHDPIHGPTLLKALSVLCQCNTVPIKRNQGTVCVSHCIHAQARTHA